MVEYMTINYRLSHSTFDLITLRLCVVSAVLGSRLYGPSSAWLRLCLCDAVLCDVDVITRLVEYMIIKV